MIMDAADLQAGAELEAAVCIAGSGPAGIVLALELAAAGLDVVLLEAGSARRTEESQRQYRGAVVDEALHGPLERFRLRQLGGTSGVWNGRCVPYDPIDFEDRPWMDDACWPIGYDEVARHYPAANRYLEAGEAEYSAAQCFGPGQPPMIGGFESRQFSTGTLERFSPPTDLGKRYRDAIAAATKVRLILRAPLTEILLTESGAAVRSLAVRRPDGKGFSVRAQRVVLAAGGMETVRLLLASDGVQKHGIGNARGVVGRFYMAHIAGTIGRFTPSGEVENSYQVDRDGVYCRRRLALTADAQREQRVGGFIARLHHTRISDPAHGSGVLSALRLGRSLVPREWRTRLVDEPNTAGEMRRHVLNVARNLPEVAGFARQLVTGRLLSRRKYPSLVVKPRNRVYSLDFHAEQAPNWASTVRLGSDRDEHGMRRLEVDWRSLPIDRKTVEVALGLFKRDVSDSGAGEFLYDPEAVAEEITRYGAYAGHHLGTTRMGADPARSVVDANCQVHGVEGLFVAGGAVFATSSQANPTLTIVALTLRLAEHLKGLSRKQ